MDPTTKGEMLDWLVEQRELNVSYLKDAGWEGTVEERTTIRADITTIDQLLALVRRQP